MAEAAEMLEDIRAYDEVKAALAAGEEEIVPAPIAHRLIDGENPVRVWREHRGLSGRALAQAAGISAAYLSQIERGARKPSVSVLRRLAQALGVTLDDIA